MAWLTLALICVAAAGQLVVIQWEVWVREDQQLTKRLLIRHVLSIVDAARYTNCYACMCVCVCVCVCVGGMWGQLVVVIIWSFSLLRECCRKTSAFI